MIKKKMNLTAIVLLDIIPRLSEEAEVTLLQALLDRRKAKLTLYFKSKLY